MGFLMGAYGKLMAGKHLRELNYQQLQVTRQIRRVTKQVGEMEKMFTAQKRDMQNQMQAQYSNYMVNLYNGAGIPAAATGFTDGNINGGVDNNTYTAFNKQQMQMQTQYAQAKNFYENMFEMQQESMLQPLKDLEEDLQTRKENLDSQVKVAEQEYNSYKEMEKAGVQNIKPEVTGQG